MPGISLHFLQCSWQAIWRLLIGSQLVMMKWATISEWELSQGHLAGPCKAAIHTHAPWLRSWDTPSYLPFSPHSPTSFMPHHSSPDKIAPPPFIHSPRKCLQRPRSFLDTGKRVVSKGDKNACLHSPYILKRETKRKEINILPSQIFPIVAFKPLHCDYMHICTSPMLHWKPPEECCSPLYPKAFIVFGI